MIQNSNSNKKRKLQNEITTTINSNKYVLEDLANEVFYEIFEYLDMYYIYYGFFNLNNRFQNLIINSNILNKINISTMSKLNFEDYYRNILIPNKNRINFLRLSNPFIVDLIFSPLRTILNFDHLETLILDNIQSKYFDKFLNHLMYLPNLHSLTISLVEYIQSLYILFSKIFRLTKLKYCKIQYQTKDYQQPLFVYLNEYDSSPIEYLIINGRFPFNTFHNLLCCLPKLQHLSINYLVKSNDYLDTENLSSIQLKYLKYISLKFDKIRFDEFQKILKEFFYHIEILRLTTIYDETYLNVKLWQELIISHMPYLRIFDINHQGSIRNTNVKYHDIINEFNSSFWTEKKWFFTHQHDWKVTLNSGVFYSTAPYRRKDYTYYWELDEQLCSYIHEENLDTVNHLYITSQIKNNHQNYFPNVNQLTIKQLFEIKDDSITMNLNRMIPLKQLTKLVIEPYRFLLDNIIKLLYFTPNLYKLQFDTFSLKDINLNLIEENEIFQYVLKTNKIKDLVLNGRCSLNEIQFIVYLFSNLQNFETGINRKEIGQIIRFLLSKTHNKTQHLFYLCISNIPKVCLKETNVLIKLENLLNDYSIKYINHDLHLWW